jgi:hypothetical protein
MSEKEIEKLAIEIRGIWLGLGNSWDNIARHVTTLLNQARLETTHIWAERERQICKKHAAELDQAKREARVECAKLCFDMARDHDLRGHNCDADMARKCRVKILALNNPPYGYGTHRRCENCDAGIANDAVCGCKATKTTKRIFERTGEYREPTNEYAESAGSGEPNYYGLGIHNGKHWILTCREVEVA